MSTLWLGSSADHWVLCCCPNKSDQLTLSKIPSHNYLLCGAADRSETSSPNPEHKETVETQTRNCMHILLLAHLHAFTLTVGVMTLGM